MNSSLSVHQSKESDSYILREKKHAIMNERVLEVSWKISGCGKYMLSKFFIRMS